MLIFSQEVSLGLASSLALCISPLVCTSLSKHLTYGNNAVELYKNALEALDYEYPTLISQDAYNA